MNNLIDLFKRILILVSGNKKFWTRNGLHHCKIFGVFRLLCFYVIQIGQKSYLFYIGFGLLRKIIVKIIRLLM